MILLKRYKSVTETWILSATIRHKLHYQHDSIKSVAWHKNSIDDPGNWKGDDPENRIWPWMTQGTNLLLCILRKTVSLRNQGRPYQ